jgi:hypothetical protein
LTNGKPWSENEIKVLRDNPDMDTVALSEKMGRTYQSVANKRRILGGTFKENTEDFDRRPSGWYVETIGTLLLHYPDAYETWKHFHRYVEIKEVDSQARDSWTYLLCRRDAQAP